MQLKTPGYFFEYLKMVINTILKNFLPADRLFDSLKVCGQAHC